MMTRELPLVSDAQALSSIEDGDLIRRFKIKNKNKLRDVNDPIPELKHILKAWNPVLTAYYMDQLIAHDIVDVAHDYLPNKSIQTNAQRHVQSNIAQFDFSGFYDSCRFDYFKQALYDLDSTLDATNEHLLKRLLIDPHTNGVTQGLPVSGALAGITLIPFWVKLKEVLPSNVVFTQYSDDLTFSYIGKKPDCFTIPQLTQIIYETLKTVDRDFRLNKEKTRIQRGQYRKVTGIRINHYNQLTPSREDYRFLRHALYVLSKSDDLDKELGIWGFKSKSAFVGKISYMRSIDRTGKIDRIIMKYRDACRKHDLFGTWIDQQYRQSAFA